MATARIEDIMKFIDSDANPTQTKTASVNTSNTPPNSAMSTALADVLRSVGQPQEKTASVQHTEAPVNDLVKMAAEMVSIDRDGEVKHAQLVGAAMADAFVSRVSQWENAAGTAKTAEDTSTQLEKFAAEQPAAFNAAVQQGYSDAKTLIEKIGQDTYAQAYATETENIHKTAAMHFVAGWDAMEQAKAQLGS
jgi:hypothetical protein